MLQYGNYESPIRHSTSRLSCRRRLGRRRRLVFFQSRLGLSMIISVRPRLAGVPQHYTRHVRKIKSGFKGRSQISRLHVSLSSSGGGHASRETHEELRAVRVGPGIPLGEWIALPVVVVLNKEHVVLDTAIEDVLPLALWSTAEQIFCRGK
jgi:hypothetical protein